MVNLAADAPPIAALTPVIVLLVAFVGYCLIDIVHVDRTRGLPKWAWAVICCASIPLGGVLYLLLGRRPS
ncbi:PLDc N-terminal domain-containing protein [Actinomadura sp. 3N407]|uniref:PLDc N-terminal domain-containing protein n=1 Tax=Actinomadura sp. 3N407 TaxID=3457423 RepID=UPI003FCE0779